MKIEIGSTVTYLERGHVLAETGTIVPAGTRGVGKIEASSPMGQAFIGRKEGDEVIVSTPVRVRYIRIVEVER